MRKLMLGNQAVAQGAYEAGVRVVSSYPGTPSTEITEYAARYDEIYCEWAPNEKVSVEVAIGASIAGARSMSCMKHVGLNVAADPLFTASYTGVNAGLVLCVADDQGMHSSQNEQDSRHYAKASKTLMLEPADSEECRIYTKLGFELSEKFDTPVLLRLSTRVSHSQSITNPQGREEVALKEYVKDIPKYVQMPAMARKRHEIVEQRILDLIEYAESSDINTIEFNDTKIGIITAGIAYQYAKEALPNASFLKLGMVYPLPVQKIKDFAQKVDKLYVIEELDPVIETHCKAIGVEVVGKELFSLLGEYTSAMIAQQIIGKQKAVPYVADQPVVGRPPVMCAGCPHRGVHYVLNKQKLIVTGDIGCYTLGAMPPHSSLDTCVCMGASVSMAHGFDKGRNGEFAKKTVAILGDSTFIHSGITSLIDIVYNKGNSTVLILDNSITGMTGHQQNPTTGLTIKGDPTAAINLEQLCRSIGVNRVFVADPFDIEGLDSRLKQELDVDQPSVIIVRRPCALLKNVTFGSKVQISSDLCKNCGMCKKLGCPAISTTANGLTVAQNACVGCGLCKTVCKFGAITDSPRKEM